MPLDLNNVSIIAYLPTFEQQGYIYAEVTEPSGVNNPKFMHDEWPISISSITNVGNNNFTLDTGEIKTRTLKATIGSFRSPYTNGNDWFLEYSDTDSSYTQGDTVEITENGYREMDAGDVSFRWCRCRAVISFSTWNQQATMGTENRT